jgi:hypothetical protein
MNPTSEAVLSLKADQTNNTLYCIALIIFLYTKNVTARFQVPSMIEGWDLPFLMSNSFMQGPAMTELCAYMYMHAIQKPRIHELLSCILCGRSLGTSQRNKRPSVLTLNGETTK